MGINFVGCFTNISKEIAISDYEEHDENTASSSSTGPSHSRRKQNLSKINENDNITV